MSVNELIHSSNNFPIIGHNFRETARVSRNSVRLIGAKAISHFLANNYNDRLKVDARIVGGKLGKVQGDASTLVDNHVVERKEKSNRNRETSKRGKLAQKARRGKSPVFDACVPTVVAPST